jgi:type VI secretion system protein ImpG
MSDDLLPHYDAELNFIRRMAAEFAEAHPASAGRLRLSADAIDDPHVARLIESFAFLTARIRKKLDDEFPELTDALLGTLYPHYLAPIPSMAVVQFACQPDLAGACVVKPGTELLSEPVDGERCHFRTGYPVTLWPIALDLANLAGRPLTAPANPSAAGAASCLRLSLRCLAPGMTFEQLGIDTLRFFLRGQPQQIHGLYELIHNNSISVALADRSNDDRPVILPASAIRPVGFERQEGLLPYPARSFLGYRLLTEFFAFPEKFLFFDIEGLTAKTLVAAGEKLEIFLYFNRAVPELGQIKAENFALGCTPVVNLFKQKAEPIRLNHMQSEYRVVPDARRPTATEVYSIDAVAASSPEGEQVNYSPFYSLRHAARGGGDERFWHASRRLGASRDPELEWRRGEARRSGNGTEMLLSLVDLQFDPDTPADWVASVETTCLNRNLPEQLPYGGGHPQFELVEGVPGVAQIACLTAPTATLRPEMREGARWRLISHLTLNHLSLLDDEEGAEPLREILRLYDFRNSPETRAIIDSILSVRAERGVARAPGREMGAFCRGLDVTIEFDGDRFSTSGGFLLASVLDRFLGLYGSINSFSRLTARMKGRSGVSRRWPPRAGELVLL